MTIAPLAARQPSHDPPAGVAYGAGLHAALIGTTRSARHWMLAVAASGMVSVACMAVGVPRPLAVCIGLGCAVIGVADLVAGLVVQRYARAGSGVAAHQLEIGRVLTDLLVDGPTHGWLTEAEQALVAAQSRVASVASANPEHARALSAARAVIRGIEDDLRKAREHDPGWRSRPVPSPVGAYARVAAVEDPAVLMRPYSDPSNLPDRLGPRTRDILSRAGAVLDDVRVLNTPQTEWAVLLFTLWSRALIVCGAPLLTSVALGHAPLQHGWSARDVPWALASAWSAGTALCAPWIATAVMRHDATGARWRRWLLVVEVPLSLVAIAATPSWPVAVFAAGWTNWWQRPQFTWPKLAAWIAVVGGLLVAAMAIDGIGIVDALPELAIAIAVVAVTGASYGAMLPVSASLLARSLLGGLITPHRARARADERISDSIRHLMEAARAIEESEPDDPQAQRDARTLRMCAGMLGGRADAGDRWARRTPLGLQSLLVGALGDAGAMSGEPQAALLLAQAQLTGDPEPVTLDEPNFYQRRLRTARLRDRSAARALRLLVTEVVLEARRHGTGPLATFCRLDGDRVVVRFANLPRPGPAAAGRGNGAGNLARLAQGLPDGRIDTRGTVSAPWVDAAGSAELFGVQVSFRDAALDGLEGHST